MTTKFLTIKFAKFPKFYCHGISQEKQRLGTIFCKIPPPRPPSKTQILLILSFRASLTQGKHM